MIKVDLFNGLLKIKNRFAKVVFVLKVISYGAGQLFFVFNKENFHLFSLHAATCTLYFALLTLQFVLLTLQFALCFSQSFTHLTGNAFCLALSYNETEGLILLTPRATGLFPESVEVQNMVPERLPVLYAHVLFM